MLNQRTPPVIFDRALRQQRLARARKVFHQHHFLHQAIADDIIDRLESISRTFNHAVALGPGAQLIRNRLTPLCDVGSMWTHDPLAQNQDVALDQEHLPFAPDSLDLIISMMELHCVNDLTGCLIQMRHALKADGLLIAAFPGEQTLRPLRDALHQAELESQGGTSPRIAPFGALRALGSVLQRAGLALPVADSVSVPITYRRPQTLLKDLRGMGETNILTNRHKTPLKRRTVTHALNILAAQSNPNKGGIEINFDIVVLTGWAPHHSQQKPLKPGTAHTHFKDVFG